MNKVGLIPVFNDSKNAIEALRSLVDQSCRLDRLVIVDDGSSKLEFDLLFRGIENLKDSRIELIRLNSNKGVSHARNSGLQHCKKGDRIFLLDSDDISVRERVMIQNSVMFESGCSFCFGGYAEFFSSINVAPSDSFTIMPLEYLFFITVNTPCVAFDWDGVTFFDESIDSSEDNDFFIRFVSRNGGKLVSVKSILGGGRKFALGESGLGAGIFRSHFYRLLCFRRNSALVNRFICLGGIVFEVCKLPVRLLRILVR